MSNRSDLEKNISITLVKDDLIPLIQKNLRDLEPAKGLSGFRPKNTPLQRLYEKSGKHAVQESVRTLISNKAEELTQGKDLFQPLSFTVDWTCLPENIQDITDIDVTVHAIFMPNIDTIDWSSIAINSHNIDIQKEDIQKEINKRAEKSVRPSPLKEDRPAQKGDFLFYTTKHVSKEGKETVHEKSLCLGSYTLPKEFEDSLVGISKGHEIKEKVRIPKNYPDKEMAGQKMHVTITFHDIQGSTPCKPDEDFSKMLGFKSLADMEKAVQKELAEYAEILCTIEERRSLKKALLDVVSFEPPPSSVQNIQAQLKQSIPDDEKVDDKELHQKALERARIDCIVKKMVKENNFSVKDAELMAYARQIAHQSGQSLDSVIAFWRSKPDHVDAIVQDILERKCMDQGLSMCTKEATPIALDKMVTMVEGGKKES